MNGDTLTSIHHSIHPERRHLHLLLRWKHHHQVLWLLLHACAWAWRRHRVPVPAK